MGLSWADLLELFVDRRDVAHADDDEQSKRAIRLDNIEFTMQRMLEKMRDDEFLKVASAVVAASTEHKAQ